MPMRKITAVFDSQAAAHQARQKLLSLGLPGEQVNIVDQTAKATSADQESHGGYWSAIKELFVPDDDRETFEESVRRGGFLLIASTDDKHADEAIRVLENSDAVDLDRRQEQWRTEGWPGPQSTARAQTPRESTAAGTDEQTIPLVEEHMRVGKREVDRGSVRVRSYIEEEPVHEQVRLRDEKVEIERRPVNQPARPVSADSPDNLMRERTIEMTEKSEEPVIAKDAVVKEELRVRKRADEHVEQIDDTVRRTKVDVEDTRSASPGTKPKGSPGDPSRRH